MAFLGITFAPAGLVGVNPPINYINTTDSLTTITEPGYLNNMLGNSILLNECVNGALCVTSNTSNVTSLLIMEISTTGTITLSAMTTLQTAVVTLNTAAVTGAYATPALLLAAPGAGKAIVVMNATLYTQVSTAFATGGVGVLQYGNTVHGAGTNALSSTIPSADVTAAASQLYTLAGSTSALTGISNVGLYFSNQTGAYTNGTSSSLTFVIQYYVVTATV